MAIMYKELNFYDFADEFPKYGIATGKFSREGLKAIYEYLTDTVEDDEQLIKLDVVAICCAFSEFTIEEALEQYQYNDIEALKYHTHHLITDDADKIIIRRGVLKMSNKMRIVKECYISKSYLNYLVTGDKNGLTEYEISLLDDLKSLGDFTAVVENAGTLTTRCAISDLVANCSLITIFKIGA